MHEITHMLGFRRRFVRAFPELASWFALPLLECVGRLHGERGGHPSHRVSYEARPYLLYLGLTGHTCFDWPWLLAVGRLDIWEMLTRLQRTVGVHALIDEAVALGYDHDSAKHALQWTVGRILLYTGKRHVNEISASDIAQLTEAVGAFARDPAVPLFYGSHAVFQRNAVGHRAHLHLLQIVLYHRGQVATQPERA